MTFSVCTPRLQLFQQKPTKCVTMTRAPHHLHVPYVLAEHAPTRMEV